MLKKLSVAVSAALISTSAFALSPTTTADIEIFMSGASAQDKGIAALFGDLCVAGTLDTFKDIANPAKPGKAHSAYFCNIDSAKVPGLSIANPKVLFHKRSAGGSAQGVNPVIAEQAIDAMVINNGNCTETAAGSQSWTCTINGTGDLAAVVSDAGVSDVNPEMFVGENTPAGSSPVDAAVVAAKMEVKGAAALVFGVPVTTTLRDALQQAEFGAADACVGDDTEACMPNLTSNQVASIISGQVRRWSNFMVNGTPLTTIATTAPSDTKVHYCRRTNGSGTQAQMNAKFLNYPCTSGALTPAASGSIFAGPIILQNAGSGDVELCLDDLNNGTNASGLNAAGKTAWAVGVQSTEKNASLGKAYRFVKVDGYAPTLENAVKGRYMDVVEQTFQWRKAGALALTGDKLTIVDTIATNASSPSTIATKVNPGFVHPWGQAGYLALSTNGFTPSIPFDATNPVTNYTHAPLGLALDNCRVPVVNSAVSGGNSEL